MSEAIGSGREPDLDELLRVLDRRPCVAAGPGGLPFAAHRLHAASAAGQAHAVATGVDKLEVISGCGHITGGSHGETGAVRTGTEQHGACSGSYQDHESDVGSDLPEHNEEDGEGSYGDEHEGTGMDDDGSEGSGCFDSESASLLDLGRVEGMLEQLHALRHVLWDHINYALERSSLPSLLIPLRSRPQRVDPSVLAAALQRLLCGCTHAGPCDQHCEDSPLPLLSPPGTAGGHCVAPGVGPRVKEAAFAQLICDALSGADLCLRAFCVWLPTTAEPCSELLEACESIADGQYFAAMVGALMAPVRHDLITAEQRCQAAEHARSAFMQLRMICEDMSYGSERGRRRLLASQEAVVMAILERGAVAALRAGERLRTKWGKDWSRGDCDGNAQERGDALGLFQSIFLDPLLRLVVALGINDLAGWELLGLAVEGVWCVPLSTLLCILTHQLQDFTAADTPLREQTLATAEGYFAAALQRAVDVTQQLVDHVSGPCAAEVRSRTSAIITLQVDEGIPAVTAVQFMHELMLSQAVLEMEPQLVADLHARGVRHQQRQAAYVAIGELVNMLRQPHLMAEMAIRQCPSGSVAMRQQHASELLEGLLDADCGGGDGGSGSLCFCEALELRRGQSVFLLGGVLELLATFGDEAGICQLNHPPWLVSGMQVLMHLFAHQPWQLQARVLHRVVPYSGDISILAQDLAALLVDAAPTHQRQCGSLPKALHLPAWAMAMDLYAYVCQSIASQARHFVLSEEEAWEEAHGRHVLTLVPCLMAVLRLMTCMAPSPELAETISDMDMSARLQKLPMQVLGFAPASQLLLAEVRASVVALLAACAPWRDADRDV